MEPRDFFEFFKVKDRMLAVQFSIDTKKFDSFRKPFVTNKYLSVIQWEEISRNLNRALCKTLKLSEEEQIATNGEFTIDESLQVSYRARPKDDCCIDFSKLDFPYELSWFLKVTISQIDRNSVEEKPMPSQKTPKKASLSQMSSNGGTTASLSSELEYDPSPQIKEIMSRYTPSKSEGPNRRVLGSPEYCPQSTDKSQPSASTYTASKIEKREVDVESAIKRTRISKKTNKELFGSSDEEELKESASTVKRKVRRQKSDQDAILVASSQDSDEERVFRPKKRGLLEIVAEEPEKRTRSHKKGMMEGWLSREAPNGDKASAKSSSRSNKAKAIKSSDAGASSKKQKTTKENKDPIDFLGEEEMQQMMEFMANEKIQEEKREERKQELIGYEMKDCTDLSNDELKRSIKEFSPTILDLFAAGSMRNRRFNPVLLTTGNILTEPQLDFALKEIEKQRPFSERGSKEDILTEIVLPELIMHLFCKKFDLNMKQALDALNLQEEYTMLHLVNETL